MASIGSRDDIPVIPRYDALSRFSQPTLGMREGCAASHPRAKDCLQRLRLAGDYLDLALRV